MAATPTKKVNVTLNKHDGSIVNISKVEYFNRAEVLLFNGKNSNTIINQSEIDSVSIDEKLYFITSVDVNENGVTIVRVHANQ